MPIVRAGHKLVYFAHVPKCGGTAVEHFLKLRFGPVALLDTRHHAVPGERRWSRTSPQHLHVDVQHRLFPKGFFDHSFAIVRHPVDRIVSAYHFQVEMEGLPIDRMGFSAWLEELPELLEENPFAFDNHTRPMVELVSEDAKIFHLEHGLDALVPWFDQLTGSTEGPRAVRPVNERKGRAGTRDKIRPSPEDMRRIEDYYSADFKRFGYEVGRREPLSPAPQLSPDFLRERDAELARASRPGAWLRERLARAVR